MKLGMRDFLNKNAAITSSLPTFGVLFPQFNDNLSQIQVLRELQEINKSGISDHKNSLRSDLVARALDISRKTEVYAKMNNNPILAKEVHYTETELNKSSDSGLKDKALVIWDKANANVMVLAEYGVNPEMLTALKIGIDLFNASIPTTRTGKAETKEATTQLAGLFKENDAILAKFDLLVEVVRLTQPEFYSGYKGIRKIINTGTGTLALTANITDTITGIGIKGVKVTFIPLREELIGMNAWIEAKLVKTTAGKGNFNIKSMADGTYTATVVKTGYKKQVLNINVAAGDLTKLKVQLEKN